MGRTGTNLHEENRMARRILRKLQEKRGVKAGPICAWKLACKVARPWERG